MRALREAQQTQFSRWLEANGHPNVSLFADVSIDQPASQEADDNDDETEPEASEDNADNDATDSTENNEAGAQVDRANKLLRMVQTTDESG